MTASQNAKLPYLLLNLTLSTWTFLAFKKAKGDGFHICLVYLDKYFLSLVKESNNKLHDTKVTLDYHTLRQKRFWQKTRRLLQ